MAKEPSFDVVSEVNMQEVSNAINQTVKEITQRFDFKGTKSVVEIENGNSIKIVTEDDTRMRNIVDILQGKFIKRGVSIKNMEYGKVEPAAGGMVRQSIRIKQGISLKKLPKISKK